LVVAHEKSRMLQIRRQGRIEHFRTGKAYVSGWIGGADEEEFASALLGENGTRGGPDPSDGV
jgi:hypothetical protein